MTMVTTLAALLFSLALTMALGTMFHMGKTYYVKALAALRMEHHLAPTPRAVRICYSPARAPRLSIREDRGTHTTVRRSARAA